MAIRQAHLNKLGLSALATRERSTGERRRVEKNKLFCRDCSKDTGLSHHAALALCRILVV